MLRLSLLLVLLTHPIRTYVTDPPSFSDRLDKLYEKLEKFTVAPIETSGRELGTSPEEKLLAKLDRLNSLTPDRVELSDEDEEMLSAMQLWGMLSAEQVEGVVKDLQRMRSEGEERSERLADVEYGDGEWIDEDLQDLGEGDYPMDANEDWDDDDPEPNLISKPLIAGVTPSAFTRQDTGFRDREVVSAVDPIAATNERPRILDDSSLSPLERSALRRAALAHIGSVVRSSKCLTPQPRWLTVRQLAPAADTVYMPPCVQLYRCTPDSGCCYNEAEVCAPIEGRYVTIPFYLNKASGNFTVARMLFFNHTRCACVSRETLQSTIRARVESHENQVVSHESEVVSRDSQDVSHEKKSESHSQVVRRESVASAREQSEWRSTEEPRLERDEEPTAPPQLRRCTCPGLFMARMSDNGLCSCVCDWPEPTRRRDCQSLAKGREHFGLRDRVCVADGDCTRPSCEYGAYERSNGRCPLRRFRRIRYHRGRLAEKALVV